MKNVVIAAATALTLLGSFAAFAQQADESPQINQHSSRVDSYVGNVQGYHSDKAHISDNKVGSQNPKVAQKLRRLVVAL